MKKSLVILMFLSSTIGQIYACYNEYNVNLRGQINEEFSGIPTFYRSFDLEFSKLFVETVDLSKKEDIRYQKLSDISIHLCRLGKVDEALELLQWLHYKYPNEYKIISNLGTTFELHGDLDSAIFYINKAIELNPNSHHGSEWIHLKILNAKKEIAKNDNWIFSNNILQLDLKKEYKEYSEEHLMMDSIHHIGIQLTERLPYTPSNDILMAKLLQEYADYMATHLSIFDAAIIYRIAQIYDSNNQFLSIQKVEEVNDSVKKYHESVTSKDVQRIFPPKTKFHKYDRSDFPEIAKATSSSSLYFYVIGGLLLCGLVYYFLANRKLE